MITLPLVNEFADCSLVVLVLVFVVDVVSLGHVDLQYPQFPLTCNRFSSTFVEHQCLPSGSSSVMHPFLKIPLYLKGMIQGAFLLTGLSTVVLHTPKRYNVFTNSFKYPNCKF